MHDILHQFKDKLSECSMFHTWHGQRRTDSFLLDTLLLIKRLESESISWSLND